MFKVESTLELKSCDLNIIPNGTYEGLVKGQSVLFDYRDKWYIVFCKIDSRYCESKANVKIENGNVEILPMTYH